MNGNVAVQLSIVVVLLLFSTIGVPTIQRTPVPSPPADETPESYLFAKSAPIGEALAGADEVDRALWAAVWEGAAEVVEDETGSAQPVFTNTKELRAFTIVALELGWNRLGNVQPGAYPKLRAAVESFLSDPKVIGLDEGVVGDKYRTKYAAACRAIAYAGRNRG